WGNWPAETYRLIIYVIAGGMAGFVVSMIAVILALAVGGPVGKLKMDASRSGIGFDMSGDNDANAAAGYVADAAVDAAKDVSAKT
ncbi:MAG TPA: hypothetical protein VN081_02790, partial [Dongiaceae bacterium]|nr:hypothetical protein [Dongiaceae bacterium]